MTTAACACTCTSFAYASSGQHPCHAVATLLSVSPLTGADQQYSLTELA